MADFMPAYVYGPVQPEPEKKPIPEGMTKCDGCPGNGVYYGAGGTVNGHFVGFKGRCYRCQGKGHQSPTDVKRNTYYDNRIRRIHL